MQIAYVVLLGGQGVAEQLLYFLATLFGPIGMCSPAQGWSRCWLEEGKVAVESSSGYRSAQADDSAAQCLSVPASETSSCLLAHLAAQSPDTPGLPTLSCTTTHTFLQHLLFFKSQVILSYFSYTTFYLQSCRCVCAPLFFTESRDTAARAE